MVTEACPTAAASSSVSVVLRLLKSSLPVLLLVLL